jgi:glycosyltransferase involved in cell wall biosynthesis
MEDSDGVNKNTVSIIIPCRNIDEYTRRCLVYCDKLDYPNKEIMLITDWVCPGLPATKRNWAMDRAKGEVIAFIDSDAYPAIDWIESSLNYLNAGYIGVCGPGILPNDAPLLEKAADLVLKLLPFSYRVTPKKARLVTDYPTFNLIVKKTDIRFKPYLTGEDTLFCEEISNNGKILYSPYVVVFHNRRPLFKPYIKQITTYGKHRGYLVKLALLGLLTTAYFYTIAFIAGFFLNNLKDGPKE